jgi:YfiH family protein
MERKLIGGINLWQFKNLEHEKSVRHFVTDRNTDKGEKEFTLSFSSSPDKDEIRNNRQRVANALGIEPSRLYFPSQIHKTRIVNVMHGISKDELMETDALITQERNVCIAVMSADCVPILLYDKKNKAVAAVHSGWRGTVARILEKTLHEMRDSFGTKGDDLVAGIGPSVCQESYEVGEEVVTEVTKTFGSHAGLMIAQPNNKAKLDLWKANELQLREFGVPASQIEVSDLCTVKNNDHFFSARKGDAGRFAAGIMLASS